MSIMKYLGFEEGEYKYKIKLTKREARNIYSALVYGLPEIYLKRNGFREVKKLVNKLEKIIKE